MYIIFPKNRVSRSVKTVHKNLFVKNVEFRKITPFGHALPPNGHSGPFWDQSAYSAE